MKTISNNNHASIKRILTTFAELKFEKLQSIKVINQQRIAKQILKKL